jgi:S-DNA-T family DNA segregation ATPase FtsK/SpoIIIE
MRLAFWKDIDEGKRVRTVKAAGLVLAAFTIFTLLATLSYLFTWKVDASLLNDAGAMDADVDVSNICGKLGYKWAWTLVAHWFGLGAFAMVLVLGILSVRMIFGRRSFSVIKAVMLSLTAAVILSLLLAFFSRIFGATDAFGGGLGGQCGDAVIRWSENLFGAIVTFIILAIFVILWFMAALRRFSDWFSKLGESGEAAEEPEGGEAESRPRKTFRWGPKGDVTENEDESSAPTAEKPEYVSKPVGGQESTGEAEVPAAAESPASAPAAMASAAAASAGTAAPAGTEGGDDAAKMQVVEGQELSTDVTEELPRINVRDELSDYKFPPLSLLDDYEDYRQEVSQDELHRNNLKIRSTLKTFKIDVDNVKAIVGPTVTLYKVYQAAGVKISAIKNLQEDIAMALNAKGVRVVKLSDSVGIEVANDHPSIVPLKALLNDASFRESKAELPVAIGYTITQKVKVFDLADAPHLLVAGATKQGKSVGLNVLITSLLYAKHPSELKFVFIDPKMVEFSAYAKLINHYLAVLPIAGDEEEEMKKAIAKDPKTANDYLKALCIEMDERYELMSKAQVNKVTLYNNKFKDRKLNPQHGHRYLPYIVVVVDEYADLTMSTGASPETKSVSRSIQNSIIRLAQKGRAAGIHVVIATQRPSVDVITGLIKSNFPTRIAFRVFSMTDSRTVLDAPGAEKLIGKGDMIYYAGVDMERVQCAMISGDEISAVTDFIGSQRGYKKSFNTPYYLPSPEPENAEDGVSALDTTSLDERFEEAARLVVTTQRGSTSDLQRRLGMGYAKAGRVMDQLEQAGIVGPQQGSKPRQVLISDEATLEDLLNKLRNGQ